MSPREWLARLIPGHPWSTAGARNPSTRARPDGGTDPDEESTDGEEPDTPTEDEDASDEETTREHDDGSPEDEGVDRSSVEVTEAGEVDPADPRWEKPDIDDIPEFEVEAEEPAVSTQASETPSATDSEDSTQETGEDPTAGMPNTARSPGQSRISTGGTESYVAAIELCARLPDDVRLPEEAADLVPAAVEAELEDDIRSFAAAEFDAENPHVQALSFEEVDGEIWMRLRLGIASEAFAELDVEAVRSSALEELEGMF